MMAHIEDLRNTVGPTMRIADENEKKKAREGLAAEYIPTWAANAEKQIGDRGPFFGGDKLNVVDIKVYMGMRWFISGALDNIPKTIFEGYPKLNRIFDAVQEHEAIKSWQAKQAKH
jgi:glutathione S-transferase